MTSDATHSETFKVTHTEPFGDSGAPAGVVAIDSAQYLQLISAEPDFSDKLNVAVTMLNSSDQLLVNESPPAGEMTRKQFRRLVERDAGDAREALVKILSDRYGFELTPAD